CEAAGSPTVGAAEVVGTEVVIVDSVLQHVVIGGQDGGGDRHDRLLGCASYSRARARSCRRARATLVASTRRYMEGGVQCWSVGLRALQAAGTQQAHVPR